MDVSPVRLTGRVAELLPMRVEHGALLFAAADDPAMFRYLSEPLATLADHQGYVDRALAAQALGTALPFVVVSRATGEIVGSTRFANIEPAHQRAEIGWTWIARKLQRSALNTECKRLLLAHAFEAWNLNRVELKTDSRNTVSRNAILRIGATFEGIFRNHMVMPDGHIRHTAWYSVTREEWPAVRDRLDGMLNRRVEPWLAR